MCLTVCNLFLPYHEFKSGSLTKPINAHLFTLLVILDKTVSWINIKLMLPAETSTNTPGGQIIPIEAIDSNPKCRTSPYESSILTHSGDGEYWTIISVATLSHRVNGINWEVVGGGRLQAAHCVHGGSRRKNINVQVTGRPRPPIPEHQTQQKRDILICQAGPEHTTINTVGVNSALQVFVQNCSS